MHLRLRRGTDAERLLITPKEAELIYVTDTKKIYVGDGSTLGGLEVAASDLYSIGEIPDVDITGVSTGQILKWDGNEFVTVDNNVNDLSDVNITSSTNNDILRYDAASSQWVNDSINNIYSLPDANYKLNIINASGETMVNSNTDTFNGTLVGDVKGSVFGDDSTVIVDSVNNVLSGNLVSASGETILVNHSTGVFQGDLYGTVTGQIVGSLTGTTRGTHVGNVRGNLYDQSNNLVFDTSTGDFFVDIKASVIGNLIGSVYGDDSALLIDSENSEITGPIRDITVRGNTANVPVNTATPTEWLLVNINGSSRYFPLFT